MFTWNTMLNDQDRVVCRRRMASMGPAHVYTKWKHFSALQIDMLDIFEHDIIECEHSSDVDASRVLLSKPDLFVCVFCRQYRAFDLSQNRMVKRFFMLSPGKSKNFEIKLEYFVRERRKMWGNSFCFVTLRSGRYLKRIYLFDGIPYPLKMLLTIELVQSML